MKTDHPDPLAYRQGWLDAHAQIGAALHAVLEELPVPRVPDVLKRCGECGEELARGEAAEFVGRDAYMQSVFRHLGNCPRVRRLDDGPLYAVRPTPIGEIEG